MSHTTSSSRSLLLLGLGLTALGSAGCLGGPDGGESQTVESTLTAANTSATLLLQSDWTAGYCASVSVTNGGPTPTTSWQVGINLNQSTASQLWSATSAITGTSITAGPQSWNAAIPPGGTVTFGFCATATGTNYRPTLTSVSGSGNGGTSGSGGASGGAGSGGAVASGGISGSGGRTSTSSGGVVGSGGRTTSSGGVTSSGGATSSGGVGSGGRTASSGGAPSSGGVVGSGGRTTSSGGVSGTGGVTSSTCTPGASWSGGKQFTSNTQGNVGNGYSYQLWSNKSASGSMTVAGVDAKFSAIWTNGGDFLARVGLGWNSTQTYDQLGTISADYAYTKTGSGGGFSYIGIYGWSENPLHEYYIVDDWFGSGPPNAGGTKVGTFSIDGGTYNVYTHTQNNQPAITGGNQTFVQFFSIRQTPRQCGHISLSEHFKEWASLGLTLGKMEEARILVEVGGGTGSINFTTATVTAK
jgi:endo-1,4-beta-xylanase